MRIENACVDWRPESFGKFCHCNMHNEAYIIIGCVKRHMENGFDEINEIAVREWKRERASEQARESDDR